MKNNPLLAEIILGIYGFSLIIAPILSTNQIIRNYKEDREAVAEVSPQGPDIRTCTPAFVAFDRNHDGAIDEIKQYMTGLGGSTSVRHYEGQPRFDYIRTNYFVHPTIDERVEEEKRNRKNTSLDTNSFWFKMTHYYPVKKPSIR